MMRNKIFPILFALIKLRGYRNKVKDFEVACFTLLMFLSILTRFGGCLAYYSSNSRVIRVPTDYTTIQDAINTAAPGDIILVLAGIYNEHITINKSIKLIGVDRATTIIDGEGNGKAMAILSDEALVDGFTIRNAKRGIQIDGAINVTISNNIVMGNEIGIDLFVSPHAGEGNIIMRNILANNSYDAIYSSNNLILENSILDGHIEFVMCGGNKIHRNNIDSRIVEDLITDENYNDWTGNFWNSEVYKGIPGFSKGDDLPLNIPYGPYPIIWGNAVYLIGLTSNSTVSGIKFIQPDKKITFNIIGPTGTDGFFNVTIPKTLLKDEPWKVLLDGVDVSSQAVVAENQTHTSIYFTYIHSTHQVEIVGTWVVPEFSSTLLPTYLLLLATVIITMLRMIKKFGEG
jgi:hypothetical protein